MEYAKTVIDQTENVCSICKGTGIRLISEESEYNCENCSGTGLDKSLIKKFESAYVNTILLRKVMASMTGLTRDLDLWRNDLLETIDGTKVIKKSVVEDKLKEFNKIFVDVYDFMTTIEE